MENDKDGGGCMVTLVETVPTMMMMVGS